MCVLFSFLVLVRLFALRFVLFCSLCLFVCLYVCFANGSAATRTVQLVHIYVPYVLWLKDQATRKGAVSVPTLRRLWTVSDSFKLR